MLGAQASAAPKSTIASTAGEDACDPSISVNVKSQNLTEGQEDRLSNLTSIDAFTKRRRIRYSSYEVDRSFHNHLHLPHHTLLATLNRCESIGMAARHDALAASLRILPTPTIIPDTR